MHVPGRELARLRAELDGTWFTPGLRSLGLDESAQARRRIQQAGRFHGYEFFAIAPILPSHEENENPIEVLWRRLMPDSVPRPIVGAIDRLTLQYTKAPREGYHDHGLMGACVLWRLYEQTVDFLGELGEAASGPGGVNLTRTQTDELLAAWDLLLETRGLVEAAVEAISYHNLSFESLDGELWKEELGVATRPRVTLEHEAHLFFLGLVDTLQDWDRHHYVPNHLSTEYRAMLPSREFMLQGDLQFVRIQFTREDEGRARAAVLNLLGDWLDPTDVGTLIKSGATYSRPDLLEVAEQVRLDELNESRGRLDGLTGALNEAIARADVSLNSRDSLGLFEAVNEIDRVLGDFQAAKGRLLPGDARRFEKLLESTEFGELEVSAYAKLKPGVRLSRGVVERSIGKGGFGEVFLIDVQGVGGKQVFKRFHLDDLGDREKRRLFRRGHRAMRRLAAHPQVVNVFEILHVPFGFFMEYIDGPDLEAGAAGITDPWHRLEVARQIAEVVAFAHGQGVLHRDIKPANILLDYSRGSTVPVPILTDFDLAWIDGRSTTTKQQYATLKYGPPELHESRWAHHRRRPSVDVYGFGAVLFFLLTLEEPPTLGHYDTDDRHKFDSKLDGYMPAAIMVELWDLVQLCSTSDPAQRLTTIEDALETLTSCLARRVSGDGLMEWVDWVAQVKFGLARSSAAPAGFSVPSVTGAIIWDFAQASYGSGAFPTLTATAVLSSSPAMEGVNFDGFRKAVRRQVDGHLARFNSRGLGGVVVRSGMLATLGSRMVITFPHPTLTMDAAESFSNLLGSITRALG